MIFIGIGSNLTDSCGTLPLEICRQAITKILSSVRGELINLSGWYQTAAIPASDQPDYINGVISVSSKVTVLDIIHALQGIELATGRVRGERNAARVLDLDMIAADDLVLNTEELILPHPRMEERAFVLWPFCEIAPEWRHPILGATALELRNRITGQRIARVANPLP